MTVQRSRRAPVLTASVFTVAALTVVVALLVGCGGTPDRPAETASPWFKPCQESRGPASQAPATRLPCMAGGPDATIVTGRATVVTLWASWCAPCRKELPVFQRLADADKVDVIGVVTQDTRPAATSLARDLNVTFPSLFDAEGAVLHAQGRTALPLTLLVDAGGAVVHVDASGSLDDAALARLIQENLGLDL